MLETNDSVNRYKVHALVDAPFGRFSVLGVHFRTSVHGRTLRNETDRVPDYMRHTGLVRLDQTRDLLAWAAGVREPAIVAGDFNTPPAGSIYERLAGRFTDSFVECGWGWGFTYLNRFPSLRIDYIFHTSEWQAVDFRVGTRRGSDHLPVFAELALK
jgi:endonuclease/exonuclease/phosphatase family metal-dependent hydrolase